MFNLPIPEIIRKQYNQAFPSHDVDPSLKSEKEFNLMMAEAMLSEHFNNRGWAAYGFPENSNGRCFAELRLYADGTPPITKYQNRLSLGEDKNKSFLNISWQPTGITEKYVRVLTGIGMQMDYEPKALAIDPASQEDKKKEIAYYKLRNTDKFKALQSAMKSIGVNVDDREPLDEAQIETLKQTGGFKLGYEIAMMAALKDTMRRSKMDNIRDKVLRDLITLNHAAVKTYIEGTRVMIRYVDPANLIARYSQYNDFRNADYAGEIRFMTIGELRRETSLTEEELSNIAKKYINSDKTPEVTLETVTTYDYRAKNGAIDNLTVAVLDAEYITTDIKKFTSNYRKEGNLHFKERSFDYELSDRQKKRGVILEEKRIEYRYKFKHILGTKIVFDQGKDTMIHRKGEKGYKRATLTYNMYRVDGRSIVESIIPIEDDINIATYKLRDAIAKMIPPPGVAINVNSIADIDVTDERNKYQSAMDLLMMTGAIPIKFAGDYSDYSINNHQTPIIPIGDSTYRFMEQQINYIRYLQEEIRSVTGVNEFVDTSVSDPRTGLGVMKAAIASTNNSLNPIFKGVKDLYYQLFDTCKTRVQQLASTGEIEVAYEGLGGATIQTLVLGKDFAERQFRINIEPLPTQQERDELMMQIKELERYRAQNGRGGITPADALLANRLIMNGELDHARLILTQAQERTIQQDMALAERQQRVTGEIQQQSAIVSEEEKRKTIDMQLRADLAKIKLESELKKGEIITQGRVDMEMEKMKEKLTANLT